MTAEAAPLSDAMRTQAGWCARNDAPFSAALHGLLADQWDRGGALRELLPAWPGDPMADALSLRIAGALHALVLAGRDDALAAVFPPHAFDASRADAAIETAWRREPEHLRRYLASAPQTNETGRSAVLLGGFAAIAARTALPLATLEIGASAGLNQLWPRFRYSLGEGRRWGDDASPVEIVAEWRGTPPALPERFAIASQAACDIAPIALADPAAALRLTSYVWPEQAARLARLRAVLALAAREPRPVERADAAEWVERQLARLRDGQATVLLHTIVWQYLPAATQQRITAALAAAGARATPKAPLFHLRLEWEHDAGQVRLTEWPGAVERHLGRAHPHGAWVDWAAGG